MSKLVLAVLFCLSLTCFAQTTPSTTADLEKTLISDSKAIFEAQKAKDTATLKRLLSSDFQEVGSEGKMHKLDDLIGDTEDGKLTDASLYNAAVVAIDDNVVIVTYDAIIHMSEGDDGLAPRYQHFSDVWTKQGEQWKLKFRQATARRPID